MAGVGNRCNLEDLETRSSCTAVVWRALRDLGCPASALELSQLVDLTHRQVNSAMYGLSIIGWARRTEVRNRRGYYEALLERDPRPIPGSISNGSNPDRARIKRTLGRLITKAYGARRTGLTQPMSQALFELEKDLRELRSSLD